MERITLLDNDVILKLATYDLLGSACHVLQANPTDVMVLSTAQHTFRGSRVLERYGQEGRDRAISFVASATPIRAAPDYAELNVLKAEERIDPGEALLFASTKDLPEFLLMTGDKRCLKALAASKEARVVYDRLRNRVVCLEELIRALICRRGFDHVRGCIARAPHCDGEIHNVFGHSVTIPEDGVLAGLNSSIGHLATLVGDGWLHRLS